MYDPQLYSSTTLLNVRRKGKRDPKKNNETISSYVVKLKKLTSKFDFNFLEETLGHYFARW